LTITIIAITFFSGLDAEAQTNGWEDLFFRANQAFKGSHYQDAIDGYEQLVQTGHESGHIYYNLGNGYFRILISALPGIRSRMPLPNPRASSKWPFSGWTL
jgi:hypothetical protein